MTDAPPPAYAGPTRVLSGVQPTGALHLGNYLGALVKFTRLQHEMETFIFVADLHAITQWQDPKRLKDQVREIAAAYLASGLDPKVATIFPQSAVPAHAELAWVFNCVARLGWLDRMTQFKDKAGKHKERESVGLYTYPVLQAADILLYRATHVPVGEDQRQHLELTRDIAAKFNHDFGVPGFFPLPEAVVEGPGARVMSLRDGSAKMSKSDPSDYSRINLTDDADAIAQKIRKAGAEPGGDLRRPRRPDLRRRAGRIRRPGLRGLQAAPRGPCGGEAGPGGRGHARLPVRSRRDRPHPGRGRRAGARGRRPRPGRGQGHGRLLGGLGALPPPRRRVTVRP